MTIDDQIRDEKLQNGINREVAKISSLLSGKINKYEYLTGEEILPSNQKQIIEQAEFAYSALGKALEKQVKTIEDQGEKQVKATKNQGQIKIIKSNKGFDNESHKSFDKLSQERMSEIKHLSRQTDLNNLTYYFKVKSISSINFVSFKASLHLYKDIFDVKIKLTEVEED